jgi:hypothetical protein
MYSKYYKVKVLKEKTWFVSGCFRSEDNLAFARALEAEKDTFEFFVTKEMESQFLQLIHLLKKQGCVLNIHEDINRFSNI